MLFVLLAYLFGVYLNYNVSAKLFEYQTVELGTSAEQF